MARDRTVHEVGIGLGDGAMFRLNCFRGSNSEGHGPSIQEATSVIADYAKHSKEELLIALAYTALQANTYKSHSDFDARLAIANVESAIKNYRERHP